MFKSFAATLGLLAVATGLFITYKLNNVPLPPEVGLDRWWGPGSKPAEPQDESIRQFRIEFNDTIIKDLRDRLKNRRPLTKPLEGIQAQYGINTDYLTTVMNYWQDDSKYNFKKREELFNKFDHFKTKIQGLDIHFIRSRPISSKGKKVLPLLMLHGWPSSSREFYKVIPALNTPKEEYDFVFDIVAADLPGYGFSEGTTKPGLSPVQIGVVMRNLMRRLGFNKFYIQAGDWGSQCAAHLATLFQDEVLGYHLNMPLSSSPYSYLKMLLGSLVPSLAVDSRYVSRLYPLTNILKVVLRESGYFHMQATKPDTIGVALTDSPTGLAAYIMEKMAACTNRDELDQPHGGLAGLDIDDVLDTITVTWLNRCIVTSMRLYAEGSERWNTEIAVLNSIPTFVPTAAVNFKYEVVYQPGWILRDKYRNLVYYSTYDFGGHFAALQDPDVFVDDVFAGMAAIVKYRYSEKMGL